mgnify:CR=1 FL=1
MPFRSCRIDRHLGTPRNYHLPSDTPDNLDYDEVIETIDFTEQLVHSLAGIAPTESDEEVGGDVANASEDASAASRSASTRSN